MLAANEMDNRDRGGVVAKLAAAPYAAQFRRIFGDDVFADADQAFARAMSAIAQFELDDPSFHPYTSKFDLYLDGKVRLSDQERRGKALFDDPDAGNCASCHLDAQGGGWLAPLADRLSVRGRWACRAMTRFRQNADPNYHDLGPLRAGAEAIMPTSRPIAGCSKPRTLRNVATRGVFFHNGRFHSLKTALEFYVQRDTDPGKWYRSTNGVVEIFDDLPPALRANVDTIDLPLTKAKGEQPVWNDAQIDDVDRVPENAGRRIPGAGGRAIIAFGEGQCRRVWAENPLAG